jgi:hypothetical protein
MPLASVPPIGNSVTFPDGVFMSSAESYPTIGEAMAAAALKLDMIDRLEALDRAHLPARTEKS